MEKNGKEVKIVVNKVYMKYNILSEINELVI